MQSKATTVEDYLVELSEDRRAAIALLEVDEFVYQHNKARAS